MYIYIYIYINDRWRVGPPPCLHCSFVVGVLLLVLSNCNSSDKGQLPVPMPLCLLLLVSGPLTLTTWVWQGWLACQQSVMLCQMSSPLLPFLSLCFLPSLCLLLLTFHTWTPGALSSRSSQIRCQVPLGRLLGGSWRLLGGSWRLLGESWRPLGSL